MNGSLQEQIESAMVRLGEGTRWNGIFLFSSEGLLLAGQGNPSLYREGDLLEFAFSLQEATRLLGEEVPVKEIVLRGKKNQRIAFHYFHALGDQVVLAVLPQKAYRRALKKLIRFISTL